ncbi:phosphomevalonate kinase [Lactobacillaceae bacterium Melli_B3]
MITVKAPGKLYIAGEYAVVEPGHPAILVAVDQFIKVTAERSMVGTVISDQLDQRAVHWHRTNKQIKFDEPSNQLNYVKAALKITEAYVGEYGDTPLNYQLVITSQLDSRNGRKYGLGSSAAVTVAVVKAVLKFYRIYPSLMTVFKLAAIAHLRVQGNGSLGDVAASVYQGWIAYQSFDRQWLTDQMNQLSITELVNLNWPQLRIERLMPPKDLHLMIGWTGSPASTANLVGKVAANQRTTQATYRKFLKQSNQCVEQMIIAFHQRDLPEIKRQINVNRHLLNQLAAQTSVNIETPRLQQMCNIADQHGGAAKSSGAGGGDCGIVIIDQNVNANKIATDWELAGIEALHLKVSYNQQEEINDQPSLTSQK